MAKRTVTVTEKPKSRKKKTSLMRPAEQAKMKRAAEQLTGSYKILQAAEKVIEKVPVVGKISKVFRLKKELDKVKKLKYQGRYTKPKATDIKAYDPVYGDINKIHGIAKDVTKDIAKASKKPAVSDKEAIFINKQLAKVKPATERTRKEGIGIQERTRVLTKVKGKEKAKEQIAKEKAQGKFKYPVSAEGLTAVEKQLGVSGRVKELLTQARSMKARKVVSKENQELLKNAKAQFEKRLALARKKYKDKDIPKLNKLAAKIRRDLKRVEARAKMEPETKSAAKMELDPRQKPKMDEKMADFGEDEMSPQRNLAEGKLRFPDPSEKAPDNIAYERALEKASEPFRFDSYKKGGAVKKTRKKRTTMKSGGLVTADHYFKRKVGKRK